MTIQEKLTPSEFNELYKKIQKYSRYLLFDKSQSDDLIQDSVERIMLNMHHYKEGNFTGWCMRIVHNVFINKWRRAKKMSYLNFSEEPESTADGRNYNTYSFKESIYTTNLGESNLVMDELTPTFDRVNPTVRDVYKDYLLHDLSHKELSLKYGICENTVKTTIFRGSKELKRKLTPVYNSDGIYKKSNSQTKYTKRTSVFKKKSTKEIPVQSEVQI